LALGKEYLIDTEVAFFTGMAAEVAGFKSIDRRPMKKEWEETIGYFLAGEYQRVILS